MSRVIAAVNIYTSMCTYKLNAAAVQGATVSGDRSPLCEVYAGLALLGSTNHTHIRIIVSYLLLVYGLTNK